MMIDFSIFDWIGGAIDLYKDLSPDYETIWIEGNGRTANQCARDQGKGWKAGDVDYENGLVKLHRKREQS